MKILDYLSMCYFRVPAIGGTLDGTQELENLRKQHPKQFIGGQVSSNIVRIRYSYTTMRGHERTGEKFVFVSSELYGYEAEVMAETSFDGWVSDFNAINKKRRLLNVKILGSLKIVGTAICQLN